MMSDEVTIDLGCGRRISVWSCPDSVAIELTSLNGGEIGYMTPEHIDALIRALAAARVKVSTASPA